MSKSIFWLMAVGHAFLFGVIYWLAFLLRFGFVVPENTYEIYVQSLPWLLGVKLSVFYAFVHYQGWSRFVSAGDLRALMWACVLSFLAVGAVDFIVASYHIPRGILIVDGLLSIVILGTVRVNWPVVREPSVN